MALSVEGASWPHRGRSLQAHAWVRVVSPTPLFLELQVTHLCLDERVEELEPPVVRGLVPAVPLPHVPRVDVPLHLPTTHTQSLVSSRHLS